jgi:ATP-dependent Lon protease
MSSIDQLLETFSGTTPIMPLADFVFFPHTVQPLHIFEPRYLEMLQDCLTTEHLLTIPLQKETQAEKTGQPPPFHEIATMGYINRAERLEDDTYQVLVTGLVKVQVVEVDSTKAYRRGAITTVPEFSHVTDSQKKLQSALRLFQTVLEKAHSGFNLQIFTEEGISVEMTTHSIISALPIEPAQKQKMLELQSLELRLDILFNFLQSGLHSIRTLEQFNPMLPTNPLWN